MEAIARRGFDVLYIESEYTDAVFCIVTRDGWYNRRITAGTRAEAVEIFMKGVSA